MRRTKKKSWTEMTTEELHRETAEFDREFVADTFHPMSDKDRAVWNRMKRRRGRPMIGNGAKVIAVSVERRLLARCDRLAKKKRVSRASLVARGLRAVLTAEKAR